MIYEKTRQIIAAQLEISEDLITPESNIKSDLGADSLALIDILMDLEEAFDVDIPEKKIGTIITDVVHFIESSTPKSFGDEQAEDLRESA